MFTQDNQLTLLPTPKPIRTILFFDTETNGLEPTDSDIIEAAGILWSVEHSSTIEAHSIIVRADSNRAEPINGIPGALLAAHGVLPIVAETCISNWFCRADIIVAHNAAFDRKFVPENVRELRPWVCTWSDIDWPSHIGSKSLVSICLAYGVGVTHAHRALTDCTLLARLFEAIAKTESIEALLRKGMRPKKRYRAVTYKFDAELNKKIKAQKFNWDGIRKEWWRIIPVDDVPAMQQVAGFQIEEAEL